MPPRSQALALAAVAMRVPARDQSSVTHSKRQETPRRVLRTVVATRRKGNHLHELRRSLSLSLSLSLCDAGVDG